MLNAENECVGFVSDQKVMEDLGLTKAQFYSHVLYQRHYKGCVLIEDESDEKKAIKNYRNVIRTHLDRSDGLSEWHNDQISYMNDIVNRKALTINLKEDILNDLKWIMEGLRENEQKTDTEKDS